MGRAIGHLLCGPGGHRLISGARWTLICFLAPVLLWLMLLIVLPHIDLLIQSFQIETGRGAAVWSLDNYRTFFAEPIYWFTFVRTALYSILETFLTFVVALPVAFFITKVAQPRYSGFLTLLLLLPI